MFLRAASLLWTVCLLQFIFLCRAQDDAIDYEASVEVAPISLRHHHANQLTGTAFGLPPWYMMTSYNVENGPAFQIDKIARSLQEQQETLERAADERAAAQLAAASGQNGALQALPDYDAWG